MNITDLKDYYTEKEANELIDLLENNKKYSMLDKEKVTANLINFKADIETDVVHTWELVTMWFNPLYDMEIDMVYDAYTYFMDRTNDESLYDIANCPQFVYDDTVHLEGIYYNEAEKRIKTQIDVLNMEQLLNVAYNYENRE